MILIISRILFTIVFTLFLAHCGSVFFSRTLYQTDAYKSVVSKNIDDLEDELSYPVIYTSNDLRNFTSNMAKDLNKGGSTEFKYIMDNINSDKNAKEFDNIICRFIDYTIKYGIPDDPVFAPLYSKFSSHYDVHSEEYSNDLKTFFKDVLFRSTNKDKDIGSYIGRLLPYFMANEGGGIEIPVSHDIQDHMNINPISYLYDYKNNFQINRIKKLIPKDSTGICFCPEFDSNVTDFVEYLSDRDDLQYYIFPTDRYFGNYAKALFFSNDFSIKVWSDDDVLSCLINSNSDENNFEKIMDEYKERYTVFDLFHPKFGKLTHIAVHNKSIGSIGDFKKVAEEHKFIGSLNSAIPGDLIFLGDQNVCCDVSVYKGTFPEDIQQPLKSDCTGVMTPHMEGYKWNLCTPFDNSAAVYRIRTGDCMINAQATKGKVDKTQRITDHIFTRFSTEDCDSGSSNPMIYPDIPIQIPCIKGTIESEWLSDHPIVKTDIYYKGKMMHYSVFNVFAFSACDKAKFDESITYDDICNARESLSKIFADFMSFMIFIGSDISA